jgi:hypothetical protein
MIKRVQPVITLLYAGVGLAGRRSCMELVSRHIPTTSPFRVELDGHGGQRVTFAVATQEVELRVEGLTGAAYRESLQAQQRRDASAIILIVDSQAGRLPANQFFCNGLMAAVGQEKPIVIQFHKRDLHVHEGVVAPINELSKQLNLWHAPEFSSDLSSLDSVLNPFVVASAMAAEKAGIPLNLRALLGPNAPS